MTTRRESKRLAGLVLIACALTAVWPIAASACSCAPPPDAQAALEAADAVVAGRVIGMTLVPRSSEDLASSFTVEDVAVAFAVSGTWKGEPVERLTVYTAFTCCICGYPFELGKTYLVYATRQGNRLTTSMCSRTVPLEVAADDLAALGPCGWQRVPLEAVEAAEP